MNGAAACALLLLAAPAMAQVGPGEQARLDEITARRRLIFAYDRAAWLGTDDLRARLPDFATRVAGYIVDGSADAARIVFFDKQIVPEAVYSATLRDRALHDARVLGAGDDRTLSALDLRLIQARQRALGVAAAAHLPRCASAPFNTVVLPPAYAAGPIRTYLLSPQSTNAAIPLGGHYEIDTEAGGRIGQPRAFTRTCIDTPTVAPAGGAIRAAFVTHLLDPLPTEVHVFSSLALGHPIAVATINPVQRLWMVDGDHIRALPAPKTR